MRQLAIVVHMAQRQWVPQLDFVFAQRVDPTADRCDMLAKVEIEALDPTFKGVWSTVANFAPLLLPDTRCGQCPQPHK